MFSKQRLMFIFTFTSLFWEDCSAISMTGVNSQEPSRTTEGNAHKLGRKSKFGMQKTNFVKVDGNAGNELSSVVVPPDNGEIANVLIGEKGGHSEHITLLAMGVREKRQLQERAEVVTSKAETTNIHPPKSSNKAFNPRNNATLTNAQAIVSPPKILSFEQYGDDLNSESAATEPTSEELQDSISIDLASSWRGSNIPPITVGWVRDSLSISSLNPVPGHFSKGKDDDNASVRRKISVVELMEGGVDLDALYERVKDAPDTVIDENEGTFIFRENQTMFEIYDIKQNFRYTTVQTTASNLQGINAGMDVVSTETTSGTTLFARPSRGDTQSVNDTAHALSSNKNKIILYKPMTSQGLLGSLSSPISSTNYRARDPTCPHVAQGETNNFVINDGFYRKVSSDRIEVLATSAFLSDDSALYDPCKDLYLQAVSLTVKGHVKWNGRNVYITAVNLTVVGDTAIIDASYQSRGLPNYDIVADDGVLPGDPGRDGQPGGRGQQGGEIQIHVGFLFGGQLVVKAAGGKGGDGQDGGNGREGSAGLPNRDSGACCSGRSTRGHEGGKGGDGGKPGKAGDGGRGGDIQVLFLNETWKDLRLLKTSITPLLNVSGGESGAPGSPGKPGHGGPGGMGSQTRCRTHGWWFRKKKMCEGPNDDSGPRGQTGKTAPPLKPAKKGPDGFATCRAIQMNEFSKYVSKELVQIAFREGNRYYKNGEFESARDVYIWVYLTSRESNDTENQLCASQSVVYLRQMAHGLDYWAHGPNNVPTNSYNNIYSYLTSDIIPYAKNVEADYDLYFDKSAEITRKLNIIKEGAAHNRFNMEVLNEAKEDKANELTEVKVELDEIIHNQLEARVMAEGISSNCKNAVDRYLFDKSVKMLFKDILNIISSAINIFSSVVDGATSLAGAFGDFVGALEAMNELSGKDFIGKISGIETIIKNISEIFDRTKQSIDSTIDNIEKQYNKIKDALESVEERNSAKIVVDGKELEKLLDEYLFLPECTDAKSKLRNYISISQSVNDKILHHDSIVLRIAALEAQIVVLESEETHLRSQESKEFDPNTLSYAIAVSRVYIDLKDSIVNQMKRLQEAYNYQFLDNRVFRYDDSRIAMIEAWVANNRMHMMDRIEMMGSEMQTFNLNSPPMTNSLILKREDNPKGFHELDQTGLLMFSITGEEDQLAPLTNVQILDVRVWVPGVKIDKNSLIVWLKRYGTSTVYDQDGDRWTFTHAPRTMLFSYNIDELAAYSHSSVSSNHLSYYIENTEFNLGKSDAFSSLSPIGPWAISISSKYNPGVDTRGVEEIYLQLAYTFLPCSPPVCHPQSLPYNYSDADIQLDPHAPDLPEFDENEDIPSGSDGIGNVSIVVVTLAAFVGVAVVTLFVAVLVRGYRKKRQVYDNISMTWDYSNNERAPLTAVQAERPDPWDDDELDKSKRRI